MSSPVSLTLMDREHIFLSNLRSSEEESSVSDLGSEPREFGARRMCPQDGNQILRLALKWNRNLQASVVPFSHVEPPDSVTRAECSTKLCF